jgi:hypothetical protein
MSADLPPVLTNANQVREAVREGARIEACTDRPGMLRLVAADGAELRAWQNALHTVSRKP